VEETFKVECDYSMEQHAFKNVNNCSNTSSYSYSETSGHQSSNLYLKVAYFFNTSVDKTSVADSDSCFPALVSNTCSSVDKNLKLSWSLIVLGDS
jgi:hypothetical protein